MSARGEGPQPITDPDASLIIYAVGQQCIVGEFSGLKDPVFPEAPDYNGAFFAVPCAPAAERDSAAADNPIDGSRSYADVETTGCQVVAAGHSTCPANQYDLLCAGPPETTGTAPVPDPALNCVNAGGPQASNSAEYCCDGE